MLPSTSCCVPLAFELRLLVVSTALVLALVLVDTRLVCDSGRRLTAGDEWWRSLSSGRFEELLLSTAIERDFFLRSSIAADTQVYLDAMMPTLAALSHCYWLIEVLYGPASCTISSDPLQQGSPSQWVPWCRCDEDVSLNLAGRDRRAIGTKLSTVASGAIVGTSTEGECHQLLRLVDGRIDARDVDQDPRRQWGQVPSCQVRGHQANAVVGTVGA